MEAANLLVLQKMASKQVAHENIRYLDLGFGGEHAGVTVRATIDHMLGIQFGRTERGDTHNPKITNTQKLIQPTC